MMGSKYKQLTKEDRTFLRIMLDKNYPKSKIAYILKVHRSTIYREIKRNSYEHWASKNVIYTSITAHAKYLKRRAHQSKLETDKKLRDLVIKKLKVGWSPGQIEGWLKVNPNLNLRVSHETIYQYIYSDHSIRNKLSKKLRRKHRQRIKHHSRKPKFPKELLIHHRPESINSRSEFGHWECDLMIFKQGIKNNFITLRERTSRFLIAIKNLNKTASGTASAIISTIKNLKPWIKSITFDQGSEFHKYQWIKECLECDIYFCEPASPEQKGAIENGNGVIRVGFPRKTNIDLLNQKDVSKVLDEINDRPMKCLNYMTPAFIFNESKT